MDLDLNNERTHASIFKSFGRKRGRREDVRGYRRKSNKSRMWIYIKKYKLLPPPLMDLDLDLEHMHSQVMEKERN
jgi:hypothetical protein